MWQAPETVTRSDRRTGLRVSAVRLPRFVAIVVPTAPWVFLAPSVGMAVLPGLVADELPGLHLAFAGIVAGLTLGVGVLVQPFARRLDSVGTVRGLGVGLLGDDDLGGPGGLVLGPLPAVAPVVRGGGGRRASGARAAPGGGAPRRRRLRGRE